MGRAGEALKRTLEAHRISQNRLAVELQVDRAVVNRWFHAQVDPSGETIAGIVQALDRLNPAAAEQFIQLYLGDLVSKDLPSDEP
ncbi:helix-turn-helix transcriptional regulator [Microcoleus sp. FACHB-1515]|nr:helix-turn-helix transcriptional regulator [Microcoleus sp. FACHB-1515]